MLSEEMLCSWEQSWDAASGTDLLGSEENAWLGLQLAWVD